MSNPRIHGSAGWRQRRHHLGWCGADIVGCGSGADVNRGLAGDDVISGQFGDDRLRRSRRRSTHGAAGPRPVPGGTGADTATAYEIAADIP
jgi:hypothetical protein